MSTPHDIDVDEMGQRAYARRKQFGWDQAEVAERSGMSREYISGLETGRNRNPKIKDLTRVASGLQKPVEWLLWGDPAPISDEDQADLERLLADPSMRTFFSALSELGLQDMTDAEKRHVLAVMRATLDLRNQQER